MIALDIHPYAAMLPQLTEREYEALKANIAAFGLSEPIVLYEGMILDGRHRYRACLDTGEPIRTRDYEGEEPVEYICSVNIGRRHMTPTDRAVFAASVRGPYAVEAHQRQIAGLNHSSFVANTTNEVEEPEGALAEAGPQWLREMLGLRFAVSAGTMAKILAVANNAPDLMPDIRDHTLSIDKAYWAYRERKGDMPQSKKRGAQLRALFEWEVEEPTSNNIGDWKRAFRQQRDRAKEQFERVLLARSQLTRIEADVPLRAHQEAIAEQMRLEDRYRERVSVVLAVAEKRMSSQQAQARLKLNGQQWGALLDELRDEGARWRKHG